MGSEQENSHAAFVESDGKIVILEPHRVRIQSNEGQRFLKDRHAATMLALDAFPTLRKCVFTDAWAREFIAKWLREDRTLAAFTYPCFYFEPETLHARGLPLDYLERAEAGLRFIVENARKQNRNDLIGNLRAGVSAGAEFEVMLAWAISSHFGQEAVELYPRISVGGGKTVEFAVRNGDRRIFIEATILLNDQVTGVANQARLERGINMSAGFANPQDDASDTHRLMRACIEKARQRDVDDPLLLRESTHAVAGRLLGHRNCRATACE